MIDVYAVAGTFRDKHDLARDLAAAVMRWEQVPPLALFPYNTAAFIHELPADSLSNVTGFSNLVRVQVLTPVGVLDRAKQLGVLQELTSIVAAAAGDPTLSERTWVLLHPVARGRLRKSPATPAPGPTSPRRPGLNSPRSSHPPDVTDPDSADPGLSWPGLSRPEQEGPLS